MGRTSAKQGDLAKIHRAQRKRDSALNCRPSGELQRRVGLGALSERTASEEEGLWGRQARTELICSMLSKLQEHQVRKWAEETCTVSTQASQGTKLAGGQRAWIRCECQAGGGSM